jgi:hypothetical protein
VSRTTALTGDRGNAINPPAVDTPTIAHLVSSLLSTGEVTIIDWHLSPIAVVPGQNTGGLYRVSGTAELNDELTTWSLILKIVVAPPVGAPPLFTHLDQALYWKREIEAYQSGILDNLPGGIRAPRCFAAIQQPDGSYHLWLEEVTDSHTPVWPLTRYADAAHILGAFNGAYLAGSTIPSYPWLVQDAVASQRDAVEHGKWVRDVVADPATWQHPLLRSIVPPSLPRRLLHLWDARDELFDAFALLPQTLCHIDAWQGNLFFPPTHPNPPKLVSIDWASIGMAPPGIDPADLLCSFFLFRVEPTDPRTLDTAIFTNYLNGLRESGWQGDPRHVRFAYAAFAPLKYALRGYWLGNALDESTHRNWEIHSRHSMPQFLQNQALMLSYLLDLADEAPGLIPSL